jgi:hypothetical protein
MPITLYRLLMVESNDVLIASGFGACITLFVSLRKGRPLSMVIGWALAGFGAGFYFGAWVAQKLGLRQDAGTFLLSFSSAIWVPGAIEFVPKYLNHRLGVATNNDPTDTADDGGGASLFEKEHTSNDSKSLG